MEQNQSGSSKMILLVLVIAAVVIAGGYLFYYQMQEGAPSAPSAEEGVAADGQSAAGTAEAEADLEAIDLGGLGAELGDIEKEIAQ